MSLKMMSWVWENSPTKGSERLVLLALADSANDDGICWPSISCIAQKANLDRRYVMRILENLEKSGLIIVQRRRANDNMNRSNMYRVVARAPLGVVARAPLGSGAGATQNRNIEPSINPLLESSDELSCADEPSEELEEPGENCRPPKPRNLSETTIKVNELAEFFADLRNVTIPERVTQRDHKSFTVQWSKPLKEILRLVDGDLSKAQWLIEKTVQRMITRHLAIKSPQSILGMATDLKAEIERDDEYRYLGS